MHLKKPGLPVVVTLVWCNEGGQYGCVACGLELDAPIQLVIDGGTMPVPVTAQVYPDGFITAWHRPGRPVGHQGMRQVYRQIDRMIREAARDRSA